MRLRTNQLYARFTWSEDLLRSGKHLSLVEDVERLLGCRFRYAEELSGAKRSCRCSNLSEIPWFAEPEEQAGRTSLNVVCRVEEGEAHPSMIWSAGPHPYTGRFVVQADVRFPRERIEAADPEPFVQFFRAWTRSHDTICAHLHDADDNSIQNTASAGMLRLGFGVDVDEVDLSENPGREVSRGEFRFAVNWLTYFGPEMTATLERHSSADSWPEQVQRDGDGIFIRIAETPLHPAEPDFRAVQAQIREALGIKDAVGANARAFGFWQRK